MEIINTCIFPRYKYFWFCFYTVGVNRQIIVSSKFIIIAIRVGLPIMVPALCSSNRKACCYFCY